MLILIAGLAGCGGGGGGSDSASSGATEGGAWQADSNMPSTPGNLSARAVSASQIDLAWTASTDNQGINGYRIYRNGTLLTNIGNYTNYSNTNLAAGATYVYAVQAVDRSGNESAKSATASASTGGQSTDSTDPSTPTGLVAAAVSSTRINLSWSSSTDNVGVTGYRIFRNGALLVTLGNVTSYGNTNVTPLTTYSYTVQAIDAAGNASGLSQAASAVTQPAPAQSGNQDGTVPSNPTGLTATTVSTTQIRLTWVASTDNVGVASYKVFRNGALIATLGTVTSYDNTGLTPNTSYEYTVQAFDAAGNGSGQSWPATADTSGSADGTAPSAPTGLRVTSLSASQVSLAWAASSDNVGVTGYRVYRNGTVIASLGAVTSYQNTGLNASTAYSYAVQALDAQGNVSGLSSAVSATTQGSAQNGSITLSLIANRVSGVAPLAVFFDATGSTDSARANPFQDIEFQWDFGDAAGGAVWNYGSGAGVNSRNSATGGVAAHIFETPGTYTVRLTGFDGADTESTSVQITVQDPAAVFSGTKTVCVSTSGNFSGAPAGCQQVTSSDWDGVLGTYLGTGKRVVFRRGETWSASTTADIGAAGPWSIGAFGSGAKPQVLGSNVQWSNIIAVNKPATDGRIMDLNLNGQSFSNAAVAGVGGLGGSKITVLRVDVHHINRGFAWDGGEWTIADSTFVNGVGTWNIALYTPATAGTVASYVAVLGNNLDTGGSSSASETTRFPIFRKSVLSNNTISGPGPSYDAIKMHNLSTNGVWGGNYTELSVISDNKVVGSSSPTIATFGPQNDSSDERLRNLVIERNYFQSTESTVVPVIVEGSQVVLRNNIVYVGTGANAILVQRRGIEPAATGVAVYNNSVYRSSNSWAFACLGFKTGSGHIAKNNVCYSPNSPGPVMFSDSTNATKSNNSTDAQIKSSNPFGVIPSLLGTLSNLLGDFDLSSGSYAGSTGTAVPVYSDFFRTPRSAPYDLGAVVQ